LDHAWFQGANLLLAQLQGATLTDAHLQGANLSTAQLQGANLKDAQLQGADLGQVNLTLSNITGVALGIISEQYIEQLLENLPDSIKSPELLMDIKYRLNKGTKETATLARAKGKNIWIKKPDEIIQKAFKASKGGLEFAKSESDYQNDLAEFFIELSCQDKDEGTASGIIRYRAKNMPLATSFAQCLLSLKDNKDNKDKAGLAVCPGLSEISNKDILGLKKMASKKEPKNNIRATFKCEL
jgi:uncharacterized protein YjbI with pentapeptide repeats